jgi:hypothetical protein
LVGLVVRKEERRREAETLLPGDRLLIICTFKMKSEYQGEKLGEQLLKKILWFAQSNRYDVVYLTVYPKHCFLIRLLPAQRVPGALATAVSRSIDRMAR